MELSILHTLLSFFLFFTSMGSSDTTTTLIFPFNSSPPVLPLPPQPAAVVVSPCAACKILRRRCVDKCILAPYFPPSDPLKFTIAHRVFGASNIIKFLQELPENQRADAVSSMVYEANARIRDPVYGSAGAICHLQKQITELQAQLAKTRAEIVTLQAQNGNLIATICVRTAALHSQFLPDVSPADGGFQAGNVVVDGVCLQNDGCLLDDYEFGQVGSAWEWDPLWS